MSTLSPTVVVSFTLNGHDVQLSDVDPNTTLNEWIRSQHGLSGTKRMCGEGGCGCCVVSVQRKDPTTGSDATISINSVSTQIATINCACQTIQLRQTSKATPSHTLVSGHIQN